MNITAGSSVDSSSPIKLGKVFKNTANSMKPLLNNIRRGMMNQLDQDKNKDFL
jgi:hypothetical protein